MNLAYFIILPAVSASSDFAPAFRSLDLKQRGNFAEDGPGQKRYRLGHENPPMMRQPSSIHDEEAPAAAVEVPISLEGDLEISSEVQPETYGVSQRLPFLEPLPQQGRMTGEDSLAYLTHAIKGLDFE